MAKDYLMVFQIHILVLNVADGSRTAACVEQIVDDDPVPVFSEIALLLRLFQQDQQFRIGVGFLNRVFLFNVGDADRC